MNSTQNGCPIFYNIRLSCNDGNEDTLISELKVLYAPSHYIGGLSGCHDNKEPIPDVKASEFLDNHHYISFINFSSIKNIG